MGYFTLKGKTQPVTTRSWQLILLMLPVVFFIFFLLFSHPRHQPWDMVIEAPHPGEILYTVPVKKGDIFTLSYIHSVSQQPVKGTFQITETGKIIPLTTEFDSFGPGLPEPDDSVQYEMKNRTMTVYHEEAPRDHIRLFVSPLTREQLIIHDKKFDLYSQQETPRLLEIYVQTS